MKKQLIAVLLGLLCASSAFAQKTFDYEVRLGMGGAPVMDYLHNLKPPFDYYTDYGSIYDDYAARVVSSGIISGEFNFIFKKWFTLSLGLNTSVVTSYIHDAVTDRLKYKTNAFTVTALPQARFTYLSKEYVKLYSAVGLGLAAFLDPDDFGFVPVLQTAPIGIMVGREFFGYCEMSLGTLCTGFMCGVGFRF